MVRKREERWEGRPRRRCMVLKYDNNIKLFVYIKIKIIIKSPAHFKWTTIRFTEKLFADCHHKGHIVLSPKTPLQEQFDGE